MKRAKLREEEKISKQKVSNDSGECFEKAKTVFGDLKVPIDFKISAKYIRRIDVS